MMNERSSIQHGIVQFLNGEMYGESMLMPRTLLEDKFDPFEISKRNLDEMQNLFLSKSRDSLTENAFPEWCFDCPNLTETTDNYRDCLKNSLVFQSRIKCRKGGCSSARQVFLEKFLKLTALEQAFINVRASDFEVEREEVPFVNIGDRIKRFKGRTVSLDVISSANDGKGTISTPHGVMRPSPESFYNQYIGEWNFMEMQSQKMNGAHYQRSAKEQEEEIQALLEIEMPNSLEHYGEAW